MVGTEGNTNSRTVKDSSIGSNEHAMGKRELRLCTRGRWLELRVDEDGGRSAEFGTQGRAANTRPDTMKAYSGSDSRWGA